MATTDSLADQLRALAAGPCRSDLDDLRTFSVSGERARETLQRVVSQDLGALAEDTTALALVLNAKGRCRALMAVLATAGGLRVVAPPGCGAWLAQELEKFLRLSRCRLEEATQGAVVATGAGWREVLTALDIDPAPVMSGGVAAPSSGRADVLAFPGTVLGVEGAVVAAAEPALSDLRRRLDGAGVPPVSRQVLELERVRRGFPAWTTEVGGDYLPHEIGLDQLAVSTRKGCYIGQETMARLETYGHPNRCLVGLHQVGGGVGAPELPRDLVAEGDERSGGALTSWAWHPEAGGVGLAVVRRHLAVPGTLLAAEDRRFRVAPFPLW